MKIENYNIKREEEKTTGRGLNSHPHMIRGFKMRLLGYLNGTHLSVFFQLMKGELDDCLEWPFEKSVSFVLIHQDNENKCFKLSMTDALTKKDRSYESFRRPVADSNVALGYENFISQERLYGDGFIKNDSIHIRCVIEWSFYFFNQERGFGI